MLCVSHSPCVDWTDAVGREYHAVCLTLTLCSLTDAVGREYHAVCLTLTLCRLNREAVGREYHAVCLTLTLCSLNTVNQFLHRTLWLIMLYYQTKFGCKWTRSSEGRVEIVMFWLYKPSLWPCHWRQWINFSAWHSSSWCCIIIPSLVSKWSVVQKISSGKTFTNILNLYHDLDLEHRNSIFAQDTLAYDVALVQQVWLQTDQQFRRYSRNSHILMI